MKRWAAWFCAALLLFVVGCGKDTVKGDTARGGTKLSLSVGILPDWDSVPFVIAREKGFFAEEGVEVTLHSFKSAMDRDAAMQSGQIDGAVSDLLAAAFAKAGGFDVRVTSATNGCYTLVLGKGGTVDHVSGLAGAEVAVSRNTIIEYVTDRILHKNGMAADAIRKISVPQIPARLEMLQNGQLTAATLPEPMASVAVAGGCRPLTDSNEIGVNPGVMLFSIRATTEKKEAVQAMYRAYNKAVKYLAEHPRDEYIQLIVEKSGFPPAVRDVFNLPKYRSATLPKEEDVAEVMRWLKEKNLIPEAYGYQTMITGDVLP